MNANEILSLTVSLGNLALALLCILNAGRSPLAVPFALFYLNVFGWTGAEVAYEHSHHLQGWYLLDHVLSPLTPALALQLVLAFAGRRRAHVTVMTVVWVACGVLSAIALAAFGFPALTWLVSSRGWSAWFLSIVVPTMTFALLVLVKHLRDSGDSTEQARTRLLLAAIVVATVLGCVDEIHQFTVLGHLSSVGMLIATFPLALVAGRGRLLERDVSLRAAASVLLLASGLYLTAILAFHYLSPRLAIVVLGSATLTLGLAVASGPWLARGGERRAKQVELATLGRVSAQMAHDIKNPLAALKGATQLLARDLSQPDPGLDRARFVALMLAQIERIDDIVDLYGRLARIEPAREPLDLNETVRDVLALQPLTGSAITLETSLQEGLPTCHADRAMMARVLENLVRNAVEAMPEGGRLLVGTRAEQPDSVVVSVEDGGCGMDARTREQAFDDFYTTKPQGSGLGLAYVQRVAQAHGGDVMLESEQGRGTVVKVRLPSHPGSLSR
jgi:signal transduction histidine kinase